MSIAKKPSPYRGKHPNRIKSLALGKDKSVLVIKTYGGETLRCNAALLAFELQGKLPPLGADVDAFRWAVMGSERVAQEVAHV